MTRSLNMLPIGGGLTVETVEPGGIGEKVGIRSGDRILSINGQPVRDVIDYQYYVVDETVHVMVLSKTRGEEVLVEIEKDIDEVLGLQFPGMRIRQCPNKCIFCFVDQNPAGQRPALYIRDEDYRFSFLYGNYITLTNLSRRDRERIFSQRLSPLYVSVHATENELRRKLLKNPKAPDIMETMREFIDHGITLQTQIVICPGINDGRHLDRSIRDLASLYPGVQSLAVVPVGLTKHRRSLDPIEEVSSVYAQQMIDDLRVWQKKLYNRYGTSFVFPSDEFFIKAGRNFPSLHHYENLPQLENGVGMAPLFLKGARQWLKGLPDRLPRPITISLITGTSFGGILGKLLSEVKVEGLSFNLFPIENEFLGPSVSVAGLIAGKDIVQRLRGKPLGDLLVAPSIALNEEGGLFIDDMSPEEVSEGLGIPIRMVDSSSRGLWEIMEIAHEHIRENKTCGHIGSSR